MTLSIYGDGPTFRLVSATEGVMLVRKTQDHDQVIHFSSMQEAHDVANAIMDAVLDPPPFKKFNISLHG